MDLPDFALDMAALAGTATAKPGEIYDLIVVGGGPAAMSAGVYAARKLLKCAVITEDFGGQMLETSEIENWLGEKNVNARELVSRFEEHIKSFDISAAVGSKVTSIAKKAERFEVRTEKGDAYIGASLVLATGKRHRPLGVPGEKEFVGKGVAYCATCDAPFFRGKRVAVAGGGNSAFTTALELLKADAAVTLINFLPGWQADEALRKRIRLFEKATLRDNHEVVSINGRDRVESVTFRDRENGAEKTEAVNGVFVEVGLSPNSELVADLVERNRMNEVVVDCSCRTSLQGLFAAGDVTTVPYKQIVISAGEGAKAALSAYDYLVKKDLV